MTEKERLENFKQCLRPYGSITPWESIKVNTVYHIPPILSLKRRDVIILEKDENSLKCKRIDDTEKKEYNIAKSSVYAKVMIKRKKY